MVTSGQKSLNFYLEGKQSHSINANNTIACRSDNCIKNYYYSTLRKHLRRINKSLKQCNVGKLILAFNKIIAKRLNIKVKNLTAEYLYTMVRDKKVSYDQIKEIDPKRFGDLEYTMKLIFNHDEDIQ
jgi:hypothetical protein